MESGPHRAVAAAIVPDEVFAGTVHDIARRLLGMRLRTEFAGRPTEVTLTEVEAYAGGDDPASHAFRGPTPRNASMFGPAGTLYVYRSYGIHWCANIVAGAVGDPSAVLLRGGIPTLGADVMAQRRGRPTHLADGPGKLCQALGIDGDDDGGSVVDGPVRLLTGRGVAGTVIATPRIGVSRAADRPWRYVVAS